MEHSGRRSVFGVMAFVIALTSMGCVDSGLPDRNLALDEAEHRQFRYPVYEARAEADAILHHDESDWAVAGAPEHIPAALLVSAGMAAGHAVFALSTDAAPLERLYVESERGWIPFARVPAGGGAGTGSSAAPH